jgi:hypothetical protein
MSLRTEEIATSSTLLESFIHESHSLNPKQHKEDVKKHLLAQLRMSIGDIVPDAVTLRV